MSQMEFAYGVFKKSDLAIEPDDTDNFYDLEVKHKCHFVKVRGQLYSFYTLGDHDAYGCSFVIEPSDETRFVALWYNGGAGIHEVVENIIERHLEKMVLNDN
jgi:hypothetical protein